MKTKECPSCAMEIDEKETTCPICGYEFPKGHSSGIIFLAILLIVVFLLFFIL